MDAELAKLVRRRVRNCCEYCRKPPKILTDSDSAASKHHFRRNTHDFARGNLLHRPFKFNAP